jgi:DNA-binding response OmpR family regulator
MNVAALNREVDKKTVLVIDDDANVNSLICDLLRISGYAVLSAADAQHGIELAINAGPDLILLDVVLPDMDGVKVCDILFKNRITATIPIIMLTGKSDLTTKITSFLAGAKRYITKPFEAKDLIDVVGITFNQRRLSEEVFGKTVDNDDYSDIGALPENRTDGK